MSNQIATVSTEDLMDRLRTIIDEEFGMQPLEGAEETLTRLEKLLNERRRNGINRGAKVQAICDYVTGALRDRPGSHELRTVLQLAVDAGADAQWSATEVPR